MPKLTPKLITQILAMIALSAIYSGSGILILSFINKYLLTITQRDDTLIAIFFGLLVLFLLFSALSKIAMATIENDFIFDLRISIVKRILDTSNQKINAIGKSNLLASLSSDISSLTQGFMRISEIVQGGFIILFSSLYIFYLSAQIFAVLIAWVGFAVAIGAFYMKKIYKHYDEFRKNEDTLYKDYQTSIEGHKELSLNIKKAQFLYLNRFVPNAKSLRSNGIRAEIYSSFASNWINVMMLGSIGLVLYVCLGFGVANLQDAVTISLTILFLRAPIMMVLFSFPGIFKAKIAFKKLSSLELAPYKSEFELGGEAPKEFQSLKLCGINFSYDEGGFGLKDVNLEINRGESIFLIGKNGSGKSTLFMIMAGLLEPSGGKILMNDTEIAKDNKKSYANAIGAIFSDFYLFEELFSDDVELANRLLEKMFLDKKVKIKDAKFSTLNLSQGQKKRLAMVAMLLEGRKFLMLDEWAADQDPEFRKMFYQEILPEFKRKGYTVFAISHDDAYFDCADKIYSIENGVLQRVR